MSSKLRSLCVFTLVSVSLAACATQTLQAQSSESSQPLPNQQSDQKMEQRFVGAENSWRLTVVDLQSQQDSVPTDIRTARNAYWEPILENYRVAALHNRSVGRFSPLYSVTSPELPELPGSIWVIATFDHFQVIPITPKDQTSVTDLMLYTEISFKIEQVIRQPKTSSLQAGSFFDVDIEGGRAKTLGGEVLSQRVFPDKYSVKPGGTYLMQLLPARSGKFYIINSDWDVTTGQVVPHDVGEVYRAENGLSKLNGMPLSAVPAYLNSVLPADTSK